MVNEQATGAIVVTSGEFTRAAIEAATRHGHVQLVDGDDLRRMLGPRLGPLAADAGRWGRREHRGEGTKGALGAWATERLVSALEDRIRGGGRRRGRSILVGAAWAGLTGFLLKLAVILGLIYFLGAGFERTVRNLAQPVARPVQSGTASSTPPAAMKPAPTTHASAPPPPVIHVPTARDIEEQRRRNAEAMEILRESTPELPVDPRTRSVRE